MASSRISQSGLDSQSTTGRSSSTFEMNTEPLIFTDNTEPLSGVFDDTQMVSSVPTTQEDSATSQGASQQASSSVAGTKRQKTRNVSPLPGCSRPKRQCQSRLPNLFQDQNSEDEDEENTKGSNKANGEEAVSDDMFGDSSDSDGDEDEEMWMKRRRMSIANSQSNFPPPKPAKKLRKVLQGKIKSAKRPPPNGNWCFTHGSQTPLSGVVKQLTMYNFMCHNGFRQEWHPNLNFVTGENGSGKSALLTGLLIGLGAKATLTSRSSSMANLIQKGKDSARTEIVLLNTGALPEDKYDEELTIERTIISAGSSSYRIKTSAWEKWRKLPKRELEYILTQFNIQLDNPIAILNQEVAKNFLRTKDPKDKYALFYEGTLLSKLFSLLQESGVHIQAMESQLMFYKELITGLEKEVSVYEVRLREFQALQNSKEKKVKLFLEYCWALVTDEETKKERLLAKLRKEEENVETFQSKLESMSAQRQEKEATANVAAVNARRNELKQQIRQLESEITQLRRDRNTVGRLGEEARAKMKSNRAASLTRKRELEALQQELEKVQVRSKEDQERAAADYQQAKAALSESKQTLQGEVAGLMRDREQFRVGLERASEQLSTITNQQNTLQRAIHERSQQLEAIRRSKSNRFAAYGSQYMKLLDMIKSNKSKFKKLPKGPIGAYITVKGAEFVHLIEYILQGKGVVNAFVVEPGSDLNLLRDLIGRCFDVRNDRGVPNVKINKFANSVYDVSKNICRVNNGFTLLDTLEVDNGDPVITNALIDYFDAERVILFRKNIDADIFKNRSLFPPRTKVGYTLQFYEFTPQPYYACKALPKDNYRAAKIKSSQGDIIRNFEQDIENEKGKLDVLQPELEKKHREERHIKAQYDRINQDLTNKRQFLSQIQRDLKLLEENKYTPPDISSHQEEIAELEEELEKLERDLTSFKQVVNKTTEEAEGLLRKRTEIEERVQEFQLEAGDLDRKFEEDKAALERLTVLEDRVKCKIKEHREKVEQIIAEQRRVESELQRKEALALEAGARLDTERSSNDVKEEYDQLKIRIAAVEEQLGDVSKLKRDYKRKKAELDKKLKFYKPVNKGFLMLKSMVTVQYGFLLRKRSEMSNRLTMMFEALTAQRGYKGQMVINHDKSELHFVICPDKSSSAKTEGAIRSSGLTGSKKSLIEYSLGLSGGERSFSTICFILSLWQLMECPFYMLDEFDVFMDALNRKASQQALVAHARQYPTRQFFLFTPLELMELPPKEQAKVIRLEPAKREEDFSANETAAGGSGGGGTSQATPTSPSQDDEEENVDPASQVGAAGSSNSKSSAATNQGSGVKNRPVKRHFARTLST